jgi:hypothetical protein
LAFLFFSRAFTVSAFAGSFFTLPAFAGWFLVVPSLLDGFLLYRLLLHPLIMFLINTASHFLLWLFSLQLNSASTYPCATYL